MGWVTLAWCDALRATHCYALALTTQSQSGRTFFLCGETHRNWRPYWFRGVCGGVGSLLLLCVIRHKDNNIHYTNPGFKSWFRLYLSWIYFQYRNPGFYLEVLALTFYLGFFVFRYFLTYPGFVHMFFCKNFDSYLDYLGFIRPGLQEPEFSRMNPG